VGGSHESRADADSSPRHAHNELHLDLVPPNRYIPDNELLLEAMGEIQHQSNSGGVIVRGETLRFFDMAYVEVTCVLM
jgi:hypothetical protein